MRIAAVGDLHCTTTSQGVFQPLFAAMSAAAADVVVLCGDLTDYGLPEEAHVLVKELGAARQIPVVAVLGNHDYESGKAEQVKLVLTEGGIHVLEGGSCSIKDVGFAGTKGLGGGFGERALQPWGEEIMKRLVRETVDEALKLESGLARLRTARRVAVLHYSPIRETVEGESPEVFAFLGSSRLEEPLLRYQVAAVVHGHAHRGQLEGRTRDGAPVYNVCLPLLRAVRPAEPPFRLIELPDTNGSTEPALAATASAPGTVLT
jgi:Icc-related predicted phosphoesterase